MEQINDFKHLVSKNLVYYRKKANLTQLELAEKINYSDKAISKWERGETIPDVFMLKQLANIYGITIDDFLSEKQNKEKETFSLKQTFKNRRLLITLMSIGLVWLIATVVFVVLLLVGIKQQAYLSFIFAIWTFSVLLFIIAFIDFLILSHPNSFAKIFAVPIGKTAIVNLL